MFRSNILQDSILALILLYFVFNAVFSKKTNVSLYFFSAISLPLCLVYYRYNAYDVALTEISVGVFLSFLFFYKVHQKTLSVNKNQSETRYMTLFAIVCCTVLFGILLYTAMLLDRLFLENSYSQAYIAMVYQDTSIQNIVTAVLASYRGFDTLGETMIIAVSSFGVLSILNSHHKEVFDA